MKKSLRIRVTGLEAEQRKDGPRRWAMIWDLRTMNSNPGSAVVLLLAAQFSGLSFCNKEIIAHTNLTGILGLDIS